MDTTHTETTPIAGIINGVIFTAAGVLWMALHLEGYGEWGAGFAVFVGVGWCLVRLQRYTESAEPDLEEPPSYEAHQVTAMRLPCGVCGQRRMIEDLRPHEIHFRVCRDGLCRRREPVEKDVA